MKQSKWNKILIPSVLMIWAVVILKFFGIDFLPKAEIPQLQQEIVLQVAAQNRLAFDLDLSYKDPFLHRLPRQKVAQEVSAPSVSKPLIPIPPKPNPLSIPPITYQGGVKSPSGGLTGLLTINGKVAPVKEGDTLLGFRIQQLNLNSIELIHPDTTLFFHKH